MAESQDNNVENSANCKVTEVNGETQKEKRIALITGITGQVGKK